MRRKPCATIVVSAPRRRGSPRARRHLVGTRIGRSRLRRYRIAPAAVLSAPRLQRELPPTIQPRRARRCAGRFDYCSTAAPLVVASTRIRPPSLRRRRRRVGLPRAPLLVGETTSARARRARRGSLDAACRDRAPGRGEADAAPFSRARSASRALRLARLDVARTRDVRRAAAKPPGRARPDAIASRSTSRPWTLAPRRDARQIAVPPSPGQIATPKQPVAPHECPA